MELISALLYILISFLLFAIASRWIFRINDIVHALEKTEKHLDDIRHQNTMLINQQDKIIEFLSQNR